LDEASSARAAWTLAAPAKPAANATPSHALPSSQSRKFFNVASLSKVFWSVLGRV
jgi:hypothetical protein